MTGEKRSVPTAGAKLSAPPVPVVSPAHAGLVDPHALSAARNLH